MSKTVKLKNISKLIGSGVTPLRSNSDYWENGIVSWLKTEQLGDREIYETSEKISQLAIDETSIKIFPINTLSIAMYGEGRTRGNVSILKNEMTTNQACCNIVVDEEKADYQYVYYYLKTQYHNLRSLSTGVRKNLNSNDIKEFEIRLPSELLKQQKIASVLSALDDKIELNNRINAELEAMAKTLYDYWFVQFDFPNSPPKEGWQNSKNFDGVVGYKSSGGKMVYNETLKREIPEGWEVKKLEEIVKKISNSINPNHFQDLKYLPIDKLPKKSFSYSDFEDRDNANSSLIKFDKDDILLGAMRVYFHRVCLAYEDGISRNTIFVLRPKHKFLRLFSLFLINKEETIQFANDNSTGSSIPYAKWENGLADYQFCLPSENLIVKFEKQISPIMDKIINNSKQNQELSALRDWLLPMLMNGQVKVG